MDEIRIVSLPRHDDRRGKLSFVENDSNIPFQIKRVYWIYDVPGGEKRGGHAFITQSEFIIAMSGSFDVVLDDGNKRQIIHLNRSYYGLYIPSGIWREMENFSTNSSAVVLASTFYNEKDYIRDYSEFKSLKK